MGPLAVRNFFLFFSKIFLLYKTAESYDSECFFVLWFLFLSSLQNSKMMFGNFQGFILAVKSGSDSERNGFLIQRWQIAFSSRKQCKMDTSAVRWSWGLLCELKISPGSNWKLLENQLVTPQGQFLKGGWPKLICICYFRHVFCLILAAISQQRLWQQRKSRKMPPIGVSRLNFYWFRFFFVNFRYWWLILAPTVGLAAD